MDKMLAFIKRDYKIAGSYKLSFLLQFFGIIFSALSFYFISKLVGENATPYLAPYGGNYFSFVLIGIAFWRYLTVGLNGFSSIIREAQLTGTLESMLVTPTKISAILVGSSLWSFTLTSFHVLAYLMVGVLAFNIAFNVNYLGALIILILTIATSACIGIISASFIIVFKRGDPINWAFTSVSGLLGGVFYPIGVLPGWLHRVSYLLPITHSLSAMRKALLTGSSLQILLPEIMVLTLFFIVLAPLSIMTFKYAVKRAKIEGSLIEY